MRDLTIRPDAGQIGAWSILLDDAEYIGHVRQAGPYLSGLVFLASGKTQFVSALSHEALYMAVLRLLAAEGEL